METTPQQTPKTPHNHRCPDPQCATIWHHDPASTPDNREAYVAAHCCPRCGREQRRLDFSGIPQFCRNAIRCIKLDGSGEHIIPAPPIPDPRVTQREQMMAELLALLDGLDIAA